MQVNFLHPNFQLKNFVRSLFYPIINSNFDMASSKLVSESWNLAATVGVFGLSVTKRPVFEQLRWFSKFSRMSLNIFERCFKYKTKSDLKWSKINNKKISKLNQKYFFSPDCDYLWTFQWRRASTNRDSCPENFSPFKSQISNNIAAKN